MNPQDEYKKQYDESQKRTQSLTDRLSYIDNYNQNVAIPQISSPGPKGYNPMNSLNALFSMITNRKNLQSDVTSERDTGLNLLKALDDYKRDQEDRAFREKELGLKYQPDTLTEEEKFEQDMKILELKIKAGEKDQELYINDKGQIDLKSTSGVSKDKQEAISLVDELLGRDTGAVTGIPNAFKYLTGENQYTKNIIEQLTNKLSVEARQKLKGSGQISDYESKMLAKSVSALRTNLSNEDFIKELNKIKNILEGKTGEEFRSTNDQSGGFTIEQIE